DTSPGAARPPAYTRRRGTTHRPRLRIARRPPVAGPSGVMRAPVPPAPCVRPVALLVAGLPQMALVVCSKRCSADPKMPERLRTCGGAEQHQPPAFKWGRLRSPVVSGSDWALHACAAFSASRARPPPSVWALDWLILPSPEADGDLHDSG